MKEGICASCKCSLEAIHGGRGFQKPYRQEELFHHVHFFLQTPQCMLDRQWLYAGLPARSVIKVDLTVTTCRVV